MATADEILAALAANLASPLRVRTDAGEVQQHDLREQVAAAKFALAMASTSRSPFAALRFAQTIAPSASGASDPADISSIYPPPGMSGLPGYPPSGCG